MLKFSQIQPQNMLKICLSKNIQKSKFNDYIPTPEESVLVKGIKMMKILKFVPSRLLKSLT